VLNGIFLSENAALRAVRAGRLELLDTILADFVAVFPDLKFELRLDRKVINAQAIKLEGRRCVLIYGGLALHPKLRADSLTFAFLHETGHHLAAGNRSLYNGSLACECVSDYWAATKGAAELCQRSGRHLQIERAVQELRHVMSDRREPERFASNTCACWHLRWPKRQNALLTLIEPPSGSQCCM
jgi:hypothetical protein